MSTEGANQDVRDANACGNIPEFWAIQYLTLPPSEREAGLRATAMNFCSGPDGLPKDYEKEFVRVLALLRGTDSPSNVIQLRAVPDETG